MNDKYRHPSILPYPFAKMRRKEGIMLDYWKTRHRGGHYILGLARSAFLFQIAKGKLWPSLTGNKNNMVSGFLWVQVHCAIPGSSWLTRSRQNPGCLAPFYYWWKPPFWPDQWKRPSRWAPARAKLGCMFQFRPQGTKLVLQFSCLKNKPTTTTCSIYFFQGSGRSAS